MLLDVKAPAADIKPLAVTPLQPTPPGHRQSRSFHTAPPSSLLASDANPGHPFNHADSANGTHDVRNEIPKPNPLQPPTIPPPLLLPRLDHLGPRTLGIRHVCNLEHGPSEEPDDGNDADGPYDHQVLRDVVYLGHG